MKKKNGFIAISIIYSFFLCFTMLMGGMLANYAHTKLIVNKINAPLTLNKEAIKPETYPEPEIPTKPNEPTIKNICDEEKAQNYLYCCILEDNDIQTDSVDFSKGSPYCDDVRCTSPKDNGNGLFTMVDDDGTSYYFRGAIDNNNVSFAGMNWKILRINGDKSIRLVNRLDKQRIYSTFNSYSYGTKYVGYTYDNNHACTKDNPCISDYKDGSFTNGYSGTDSRAKQKLETWYIDKLTSFDSKIALTRYCNDTSIITMNNGNYTYTAAKRVGSTNSIDPVLQGNPNPSLNCPDPTNYNSEEIHNYGGVYKLKIGLPTVDELIIAGIGISGFKSPSKDNFLYDFSDDYYVPWTLSAKDSGIESSKSATASVYFGPQNGIIPNSYHAVNSEGYLYPVINLRYDVAVSKGNGENSNPYVIE